MTPTYPPTPCGIGDYSLRLAAELSDFDVTTVTAEENRAEPGPEGVVYGFRRGQPSSLLDVLDVARRVEPDWILVQYCPTAYGGRYGFDVAMPRMLRAVRGLSPRPRVALVVHETSVVATGFRRAAFQMIATVYLSACAHAAALLVVPVEAWKRGVRRLANGATVVYAPVASNIDVVANDRVAARSDLGIEPSDVAVGLLGRLPRDGGLRQLRTALHDLASTGRRIVVLYTGQDAERAAEVLRHDGRLVAACGVDATHLSIRLQCSDIFLAPFDDGASSRRTSLMAAIAHGLPVVTTRGPTTDPVLIAASGNALELVDANDVSSFSKAARGLVESPEAASRLSEGAQRLYAEHYSWDRVAHVISEALAGVDGRSASPAG